VLWTSSLFFVVTLIGVVIKVFTKWFYFEVYNGNF
jgi:membrane-bound metal-dependent hydrolase YbcI (DUF457 family)